MAGQQRTPRALRWKRDGELCPSLAPGCLPGAVVFLPTVILGSLRETITSYFWPCFRDSEVARFFSQARCAAGGFLHSVTVWRVEARKPAWGGNGLRVDLGKALQEKQPKHVGSKAGTLGMSRCQCREAGEDVTCGGFGISLEGKGCGAHSVSPEVVQRLQREERSESVCVQPLASFRQCFSKKKKNLF